MKIENGGGNLKEKKKYIKSKFQKLNFLQD